MLRFFKSFVAAAFLSATVWSSAGAANIPYLTGPQDPSQLNATINSLIQQLNSLITPQSMAQFGTFRNLLDNGAMLIQQRGTGAATCGTTAMSETTYGPDRWTCNVNVTSGAGTLTPTTSTPAPPPGFLNQAQLIRNSGSLAQPVCVMQEIPTNQAVQLQGQQATFSFY